MSKFVIPPPGGRKDDPRAYEELNVKELWTIEDLALYFDRTVGYPGDNQHDGGRSDPDPTIHRRTALHVVVRRIGLFDLCLGLAGLSQLGSCQLHRVVLLHELGVQGITVISHETIESVPVAVSDERFERLFNALLIEKSLKVIIFGLAVACCFVA